MHTWLAGFAVLVEHPVRRAELATYCCTYALDSLYRWAVSSKLLPSKTPFVGAATLAISTGVLCYNFEQQSSIITKWLLGFDKSNGEDKPKATPEAPTTVTK